MADKQDDTKRKQFKDTKPITQAPPHIAFPTLEDLPKAYKASKWKKSRLGGRFNGKHRD